MDKNNKVFHHAAELWNNKLPKGLTLKIYYLNIHYDFVYCLDQSRNLGYM